MIWYDIGYIIYDMMWYDMIGVKINSQGYCCITLSITGYLDFVPMCVIRNRKIKKYVLGTEFAAVIRQESYEDTHPVGTSPPSHQKKIQFLKQYSILNMDENELPKKYYGQTLEVNADMANRNQEGLKGRGRWKETGL